MKTCKNCKHSIICYDIEGPFYTIYCGHEKAIDYVTGDISYPQCKSIRNSKESECSNWEEKDSRGFIKKIIDKIKNGLSKN